MYGAKRRGKVSSSPNQYHIASHALVKLVRLKLSRIVGVGVGQKLAAIAKGQPAFAALSTRYDAMALTS